MNLYEFNETFKKLHTEDIVNAQKELTPAEELHRALEAVAKEYQAQGVTDLKDYEVAFQSTIEDLFPDKSWWEVTKLNIFWDLFTNRNISGTIDRIIDNMEPDVLHEAVEKPQEDVVTSFKGRLTEICACAYNDAMSEEDECEVGQLKSILCKIDCHDPLSGEDVELLRHFGICVPCEIKVNEKLSCEGADKIRNLEARLGIKEACKPQ